MTTTFQPIRIGLVREELAATLAMGAAVLAMALLMIMVTGCGKEGNARAESMGNEGKVVEGNKAGGSPGGNAGATTPVERGKYLVTIGGCNDCHTPLKMGANGPEPDMSRMLSGHPESVKITEGPKVSQSWVMNVGMPGTAFAGPWGISFAMNLTPDSVSGIGTWSEDLFKKAIRTGKHWGTSRPIMPPMPWPNVAQMTDEDFHAVYSYLRSIPPVRNQVPAYIPPSAPLAAAGPQH